jgi:hypothetical protein
MIEDYELMSGKQEGQKWKGYGDEIERVNVDLLILKCGGKRVIH